MVGPRGQGDKGTVPALDCSCRLHCWEAFMAAYVKRRRRYLPAAPCLVW